MYGFKVIDVIAMADEARIIIIEQARVVSIEEAGIYNIPTMRPVRNFSQIRSDR